MGEVFETKQKPVKGAISARFRFPVFCSVFPAERVKDDWGENCTFWPCKIQESGRRITWVTFTSALLYSLWPPALSTKCYRNWPSHPLSLQVW